MSSSTVSDPSDYRQLWLEASARNAELTRSLLPERLAAQLARPESILAEGHADVTVLFADIVGFTRLAAELTPYAVVELLDSFFGPIDLLCEQLQLEKIKTIGDAYMLAGGLEPDGDGRHTERVLEAALDILTLARRHPPVCGERFAVRIGFATGPVVAGVIGRKKLNYDLWGDTVNLAMRLCDEAVPMEVLFDELSFLSLAGPHGSIGPQVMQIRGKGPVQTYRLQAT
ncbi:adenylate/guanylate cyclase domain-containing protein [Chitinimonas lacunae]|uniref:Adenylate/guanylate cyclase domain-containing protein n=1 Tax=Chitinimonas lacunae TaxID=1963018 RepID=A0ABV8MPY1_9NEIS